MRRRRSNYDVRLNPLTNGDDLYSWVTSHEEGSLPWVAATVAVEEAEAFDDFTRVDVYRTAMRLLQLMADS